MKKKKFDAVGCIVELGAGRRWALAGAGRAWLGGLCAAGAGRVCVLGVPGARGRRA